MNQRSCRKNCNFNSVAIVNHQIVLNLPRARCITIGANTISGEVNFFIAVMQNEIQSKIHRKSTIQGIDSFEMPINIM